jgi:HK97 family phage prohead protease
MKKYKRYTPGAVELREEPDKPAKGFGHFLVFNQETELWPGFREKIDSAALDDVMDNDVAVMTNHDSNLIMARTSAGNAKIGKDSTGGTVEWVFPDTTAGRDTRENMRVGNITGMSFGFTVKDDKLERDAETGNVVRTILKLERLYDASPVAFPAYQQTDVGLREEYRAEIESREDYPKEEEQPPVVSDPDDDKAKVNAEQKTLALRISINKNKNA